MKLVPVTNKDGIIHGALAVHRLSTPEEAYTVGLQMHDGAFCCIVVGRDSLARLGGEIRNMVGDPPAQA